MIEDSGLRMGMLGSGGDSLVAQLHLAAAPTEPRATCRQCNLCCSVECGVM